MYGRYAGRSLDQRKRETVILSAHLSSLLPSASDYERRRALSHCPRDVLACTLHMFGLLKRRHREDIYCVRAPRGIKYEQKGTGVCVCVRVWGGERGCKGRRAKSLEFVTSSVQSSKPLPCVKRRIYNKSIAVRVISTI